MRTVICCMSLVASILITGCGQTGALQLPSDPNYDKRAQYLLYKDRVQTEQKPAQIQADGQLPTSEATGTN